MDLQTEGAGPSRSGEPSQPGESRQFGLSERVERAAALQWYTEYLESHNQTSSQSIDGLDEKLRNKLYGTSTWLDWTVGDKSRFFASVSRHSRLRADLIAIDCSKPKSEIYLYLDALDKGLNNTLVAEASEKPESNTPARKKRLRESKTPAARESSEDWIRQEEIFSQLLLEDNRKQHAEEEAEITSKRRHLERRGLRSGFKEVGDRKERHGRRKQALEEMETAWAVQDWGRSLDESKLAQLNKLTKSSWSEWYKDRVRPTSFAFASLPDTSESDDDQTTPLQRGPTSCSKHTKIAIDNARLRALQALNKRDRTPGQRADLAKLVNRKRNRDNVRTKRLLELGMTDEDIKREGGIDKAFLKSIGQEEDAESAFPAELEEHVKTLISSPFKTSHVKSMSRQTSPADLETSTVSEEDAGVKYLRQIGLDNHVCTRNLDIVNFEAIVPAEDEPHFSLPVLETLVSMLQASLQRTMLRSVLIAEAEAIQTGDVDGIESRHVEIALADAEGTLRDVSPSRYGLKLHEYYTPEPTESLDGSETLNEIDQHLTEDEDDQIEKAANDMDETMDKFCEGELWRGTGARDDLNGAEDIERARKAYSRSIRAAHKARRARHGTLQRSMLFPSTNYRRPSRLRKKRKIISSANIDDSDDQSEIAQPDGDATR